MTKVMKADASAAAAYAEFDFVLPQSEVWLTYEVAYDPAALAYFSGGAASNDFGDVFDAFAATNAELNLFSTGPVLWQAQCGTSATPAPVASEWTLIEMHTKLDGTCETYVGGTLVISGSGPPSTSSSFTVGQNNGSSFDPSAVAYIRHPKAGTTRGGTDLFNDDFSSGDFSAWSSTSGTVSVVDDPFPTPPPTVVYARVYGINLTLSDDGVEQVSQLVTSPDGFS